MTSSGESGTRKYVILIVLVAAATAGVTALLLNVGERKAEARTALRRRQSVIVWDGNRCNPIFDEAALGAALGRAERAGPAGCKLGGSSAVCVAQASSRTTTRIPCARWRTCTPK